MSNHPILYLKKNAERRLYQGHVWIYSNEVDVSKSSLKSFIAGEIVTIKTCQDKVMGQAYINPATLITARLLSRDTKTLFDKNFFIARISEALFLRESFFTQPFYRLIYAETDRLPGLIVDRYDDVLVAQLNTAGMQALCEPLLEALLTVLKPKTVIFRNDSSSRKLEELIREVTIPYGSTPEFLTVIENGVKFLVPALTGQKTGWFYDHRDNRQRLNQLVKNKRVLDVFSYMGGWGIQALCYGAKEVISIDSSAAALAQQIENAKLNNVAERLVTINGDAFDQLVALRSQGERFDVVVLDPPALIKRYKDFHAGMQAYFFLNKVALELLAPNGLLISASCSHHLGRAELRSAIWQLTEKLRRPARLIAQGCQGLDHPVHLAIPESEYLKAFFVSV